MIGCLLLALASVSAARPPSAVEAPRATDLLRAEHLAEQARQRLELPRSRATGWRRGGRSWSEEERTVAPAHVTIHVPRGRVGRK